MKNSFGIDENQFGDAVQAFLLKAPGFEEVLQGPPLDADDLQQEKELACLIGETVEDFTSRMTNENILTTQIPPFTRLI